MDEKELRSLIERGESDTIEFKRSTAQLEKSLKAVCGFLNHRGGAVYFGIEKGKMVRQEVSDPTLRSISQKIRQRIKPEVTPEINVLEIKGRKIIEVKIKEGNNKPYYLDGIAYRRVGSENVVTPPGELEGIILQKRRGHWDSEVCENARLEDIDKGKVRRFLGKARTERNFEAKPATPAKEALDRLGLTKGGKLKNAAVLLFGKHPGKFFPQAETRCARFRGIEPVKPFLDMKILGGTVYEQVDEAEKFVLNNIKKSAWTEPGKVERQEKWEYPMDAVREAITNAVCHRDYESSSNAQIRIFDDRLEVWNPGRLPDGWTTETLRKKHESRPYNPSIARVFFLMAYIEQWGTGTTDIVKDAIRHGLPEPLFEDTGTSIVVTFRKYRVSEDILRGLNERQKTAVAFLRERERITLKEYRGLLHGATEKTAYRDLKDMEAKGIVKGIGEKRGRRYVLA